MNDRFVRRASQLLISLPWLSLTLAALAWLRFGIDMPWFDDWRGYAEGNIGSLELHYLFRAVNDTMAPVGFALDALAQRLIDGNTVVYQLVSMTLVLGSLLLLQWKLLYKALGSQLQAAACFSLAILMLQPDSYWGRENLAYHQCLPLVLLLSAMWLIVCPAARRAWHLVAIPALGLVAGFTYISGAFAALTAGVSLLVVGAVSHKGTTRAWMLKGAGLLAAAGVVTVGAQAAFSLLKFASAGTHAGIPMALPNQPAFWMFFLGKMGRSLLLPASETEWSLVMTLVACAVAAGAAVALLLRCTRRDASAEDKRIAAIYVTLLAVVFVYMMMVAAGRTNYRDPQITKLLDIFAHGFTRFHFFWAALVWPWTVAAIVYLARRRRWAAPAGVHRAALALVLAVAALLVTRGGYDHMQFHRELAASRLPVAQCLLQELQNGGEIKCVGLVPPRLWDETPDAYPAYVNARKMGASFVRYFPILPKSTRRSDILPFYDMKANSAEPELFELERTGKDMYKATGADPRLQLQTGDSATMHRCTTIDVDVALKSNAADMVQVYFQPFGITEFSEKYSYRLSVTPSGAIQTQTFRLESPSGFRDALRIDPGTYPQKLVMPNVRVYCIRQQP